MWNECVIESQNIIYSIFFSPSFSFV
jgi:hypothetical protein